MSNGKIIIIIFQFLLPKNAEVHAQDKDSDTALVFASKEGHREVKEMLIKAGAK